MKRLLILGLLAGLLGLGISGLQGASRSGSACSGCCTSSADCPTPACCSR